MKSYCVVMLTLAVLVFLPWVPLSLSCNKALCASDVSKCLIQVCLNTFKINIKVCYRIATEHIYTDMVCHKQPAKNIYPSHGVFLSLDACPA